MRQRVTCLMVHSYWETKSTSAITKDLSLMDSAIPVPSWCITVLEQWLVVNWRELPSQGLILSLKLLTYLPFLIPGAVYTPASYPCLATTLDSSRIQVLGWKRALLQPLSKATESQRLPWRYLTVVLMRLMGIRNQRVSMAAAKLNPSIISRAFQSWGIPLLRRFQIGTVIMQRKDTCIPKETQGWRWDQNSWRDVGTGPCTHISILAPGGKDSKGATPGPNFQLLFWHI